MSTTAIVVLLLVVGVGVLVWKRSGMSAGRAFGNRVAQHIGIPKNRVLPVNLLEPRVS